MKTVFLMAYSKEDLSYTLDDPAIHADLCVGSVLELFELPSPPPKKIAFILSSKAVEDAYRVTVLRDLTGDRTGSIQIHLEDSNEDDPRYFIGADAARWVDLHQGDGGCAYVWVQF